MVEARSVNVKNSHREEHLRENDKSKRKNKIDKIGTMQRLWVLVQSCAQSMF